MCQKTVVTHSTCGHEMEDIFPCETFLDTGSCPSSEPKTTTEESNCPSCEDDAHLAAAMKQIETDASLAAVPTRVNDPSAPKRWAKTREYFIHCGHFANVIQQDFELEDGSPEYITEELPGSCHRCCASLPWQIELKKQRGEWNDDPWGEMQKLTTTEEVRSIGGDVGPSRQPAMAKTSGSAPPGPDFDTHAIHLAPAALPGARHIDYGGEDGNGDTTPGKNKDIVNPAPRTRVAKPEPEPEYDLDDEEVSDGVEDTQPPPHHFSDDDDDSTHAQIPGYTQAQAAHGAYADEDSSDDGYPATLRATREHAPSPQSHRSYSRSPPASPSGHLDLQDMAIHSDDEDVDDDDLHHGVPVARNEASSLPAHDMSASHETEEFVEISPEDRLTYKIPGLLKLTAAQFESLKRRLTGEAGLHMTKYRAGELSEQDK